MNPELRAAANVLVHVPDLVRYGSKCFREIAVQGDSFSRALSKRLRTFDEAVSYPPNQAFIGNIPPERLREVLQPWHAHPAGGASARGAFGEILNQKTFYALLEAADLFGLLAFERPPQADLGSHPAPLLKSALPPKTFGGEDILRLVDSEEALPLYQGDALIGCAKRDHETDESLGARILLENLAAKASGAYVLRNLLEGAGTEPDELEYVISCSEEAVGDRYNRGGGNLAKAIAEMAGCANAAGTDVKSFCAAPVVALVHGAALIQAGVVRNVAVVGGGSLAKLGMKAHRHLESDMPVLEDVLGSVAFLLVAGGGDGPRVNLEIAGRHTAGKPSTPQGLAEVLVRDPLARAGRRICEIDKYAVELHDPGVTVPAGAGNVPQTNYRTLAALAVMAGEIGREDIVSFVEERGMPGFAPTQGHVPAGVPYLGHALVGMRKGVLRSTMVVAKGSLFLGRMSQNSDGASVVIET